MEDRERESRWQRERQRHQELSEKAEGQEKQRRQQERDEQFSTPRPPRSLRDTFLHALPYYTGPYSVGYLEAEIPVREPRTFSNIKRNHRHALRLDTVLFAIYYPADLGPGDEQRRKLCRVSWLSKPRVATCKGYAKFMNIPHLPVTAYIAATSMFTRLPAYRDAKLARDLPDRRRSSSSDADADDDDDDDREKIDAQAPKFPCIIFSHGLGGSRTYCSTICGELASYGFIVVALEHRDGSGARTYVNIPHNHAVGDPGEDAYLTPRQKKQGYYMVDYIFPKDNAQDTSPNNARGIDTELRTAQVEMRLAEIEEAFHVLNMINDGRGDEVCRLDIRGKGSVGPGSHSLDEIDWRDWHGRIILDKVTVMGHSFGGATTVQILRLKDRFPWVGQGVLLDAWGPATPACSSRVCRPLLSIGSEAFMHWKDNFQSIEEICQEARGEGAPCWMLTIRGSTHLSQTDFAMLYPNWMSLLMKTIVSPRRALHLTIASTLEFLEMELPEWAQRDHRVRWANERLLEQSESQTDISLEHRPDDKWIAARLKIEHEFSLRLSSWLHRKKNKQSGIPPGPSEKRFAGLKNWGLGSEIWMHLTPDSPHRTVARAVPAEDS